jgi:PAS domain S-box-containing protein
MDEILSKIKIGESVNSLETFRVKKDGSVIEVAVTISPITNDDGVVIGASTIARDISFKKAEDHLRASEEQYRSLVDNIAVGVYRSTGDPAGRFIWGNTSLVKILGHSSLETLKKIDIADIFAQEGGRRKLLEELKQAGFVKNREILLKRADGKTIHVMVTALAKFDPKGDLVYINGLVEDITSQRQAESQLQTMRDEIVDIIEFQPDATFVIDNEKNVIAWNSAIERLTGIKKADIIGKGDYAHAFAFYGTSRPVLIDLIDSSDEELHQYYAEVKREGTALVAEVFAPALNTGMGAFLWAKASPLVDLSDNRIGAIETIRDISDSKRLQAQTVTRSVSHNGDDTGQTQVMTARANAPAGQTAELLSLIYLSNALRMAQDGITILDLSARCIWVNEALNSLLCTGSSEAITGKSIASYIASEMRKTALDQISEVRRLGHAEFPLSLMTPGGRVPVEARVSAVSDQGGELLGYMAILRRIDNVNPKRFSRHDKP